VGVVRPAELLARALGADPLLREVIAPEDDVRVGVTTGLPSAGEKRFAVDIIRHAGLGLGGRGQRHMGGHLVAVEVGSKAKQTSGWI